jgi:hypothetical protein
MSAKHRFTATDIALTSVFCAMYAALNITLAPLSMAWFGLPILCDFAVFFTLLLAVWATGKFGVASLVGMIGSPITLLRGNQVNLGFAPAAVLFDFLLLLTRHRLEAKPYSLAIGALATAVSAYFAGVVIALLFLNRPLNWAVTFWGVWHLIGGAIAIAVTLPVIGVLERTNVKAIRSGERKR